MAERSSSSYFSAVKDLLPEQVSTPVGDVEVRFSLPAGERVTSLVLLVHGMSPDLDIVFEWAFLLEALRQRKVACVLPNLHSNARTTPRGGQIEDVTEALQAILGSAKEKLGGDVPLCIYGKSWGGGVCLELNSKLQQNGHSIAGICLACPYVAPDRRQLLLASVKAPLLLAWAKDDLTIPYDNHSALLEELQRCCSSPAIFLSVEEGGHRVDKMAASNEALASKLAEWPDLVLGPLADLGKKKA